MNDKPPRRYQQMPPSNDWLDRLTRFNLHFGRYLRDALGVFLIATGAYVLVGACGISPGVFYLRPGQPFWPTWFGWGSYLLILAMAYGGFTLIRRDFSTIGLGTAFNA